MRLKTISIKNFLSYGPNTQSVDFSEESIISFIGNNGHGKSALLEAITWSIWGQARRSQGVSKSDDMLIHLGETLMTVAITIEVKKIIYQIERICEKKNNRIYTCLSLFNLQEETGEIHNLSSAHQKDTQDTIEKIIGINYDIFINTVYLKQGNSNEFSKKTAKERKDILCSLLKINKIEEIRQSILEDIKKISTERDLFLKIEEKLLDSNKNQYTEELTKKFEILNTEREETKKSFSGIENNEIEIKTSYSFIEEKWSAVCKEIELEKKEIELLYATYKPLRTQFLQYLSYKNELKKILNNKFLLEATNEEDSKKSLSLLDTEEKEIIKKYGEGKKVLEKKREEILSEEETLFDQSINTVTENDVEKIKEKITICSYHLFAINCPECPLCLTPLDEKHKKIMKENFSEKERIKLEQKLQEYSKNKEIVIQNKEKKKSQIKENYLKDIAFLDEKFCRLSTEITQKKKILQETLAKHEQYRRENQNIFFYEKNIAEFKAQKNTAILKEIIHKIYAKKNILFEKKKEEASLHGLVKKNHTELSLIIKEKELIKQKEYSQEKKILEIQSYLDLLKNQIKEEEIQLQDIKKKIIESEKNLKIKSNLAHILSKNNLQASIIEEAIPFIEEESNRILEKLTNGSSKIYIESMRDLKSGTIKETLDIKISDPVGIRYYEFFSGGEAFRIDLALRIALIKLLTKCSGYSVKTFIIDEGFGSQDSNNLENIIQTLYLLQSEFDLIIIISHLNDMKEQFPIQFLITKEFNGSVIEKI